MTIKAIIFDFDGTIGDTYQAVVDITNGLSSEFGYKPLDTETSLLLKNLSSKEIVKQSEVSLFKLPFLVKRIQTEMGKQIEHLVPITGIPEVLKELKSRNYLLGIITSNAENNVTAFLHKQELAHLFDFIYSGATLFGKHRIINRVIKKHHLAKTEVIYVGDETRDIRSAKKSKVAAIAVTWGFQSESILRKHNPTFLAQKPSDILDVVLPQTPEVTSNLVISH